jgi:hypothetical protein
MAGPGQKKTGGRKKGTPNKNSAFVRRQFEKMGFNPLLELVDLYKISKEDFTYLVLKIAQNKEQDLPMFAGLTDNEQDLYKSLPNELANNLHKMLPFMYPKLKALEVNQGEGRKITFQLNTGGSLEIPIADDSTSAPERTYH